jgi:hypothetical protein
VPTSVVGAPKEPQVSAEVKAAAARVSVEDASPDAVADCASE